jgi:hypothetical protein
VCYVDEARTCGIKHFTSKSGWCTCMYKSYFFFPDVSDANWRQTSCMAVASELEASTAAVPLNVYIP